MIIGETLVESAPVRFSPWFERRGDAAGFACHAIAVRSPSLDFLIKVQTKNQEETDGAATDIATFPTIDAVGVVVAQASGLKELIRYKYLVSSDPPSGSEWVHFEMLDPAWRDN